MTRRCRLCTTNDRDGLVEQVAAELWDSCRDGEIDPPWDRAGAYWQEMMRTQAAAAVRILERDHG